MAGTSSLNCLFCRIPYQRLHSLNAWTPFSEKALFFTEFCFVASPSQNSVTTHVLQPRLPLTGISWALRARNPERVSEEISFYRRTSRFAVFQTKVASLFLPCSHKHAVAQMFAMLCSELLIGLALQPWLD